MKQILITGSNGLLGQNLLSQLLQRSDLDLLALSKSGNIYPEKSGYRFIQADISDALAMEELAKVYHPDVIIHAAAVTQVDPCELNPEECFRVNVEGTRNLAQWAEKGGSHFIYVSTDFVYDGENGPYRESDPACPVSQYGWSKLEGEQICKDLSVPWTIVRTILVYGVTPAMSRSNLVLWVKNELEQDRPIRVVEDQFRMPTLVDDLAWGIIRIMDLQKEGIYHLCGPELASILDLALITARFFKLDTELISPILSASLNQPGRRPKSTGFILEKARKELNYSPKKFQDGLAVVQNLLEKYS